MAVLSAVRAKAWLVLLKSSEGARGSLSLNVIREVCSYFQDSLFAAIFGNRVHLYDYHIHNTTEHTLPISVLSGYIQLYRTTVLIVGKEVLTLDLLTLHLASLSPLLTPRNGVGVAQVGTTVFAFGGWDSGNRMKVCEKSSVPFAHWTALPPMHYARGFFTPCAFKALLYLTSTHEYRAVESFSPHTETFTVLPVSLPADLDLGSDSVTFVANGDLLILMQGDQMARWKIESESSFCVSTTDRGCCSYCPPLIVGTEVYIANFVSTKVDKWNLETNRFV